MINQVRNILLSVAVLAVLPGMTAQASIVITLNSTVLNAIPGQTITYRGTITNQNAVNVDLNGCDITLPGPFTADCNGSFLSFAPLFLLPNQTSSVFDMFTVTVNAPFTGSFGLQPAGAFTVLGGLEIGGVYDDSTQNVLNQPKSFAVNVAAPEPGSAVLVGLILPLVFALRRRRS